MTKKDEATTSRTGLVGHVKVGCEAILGAGEVTIGELEKLSPGDTVLLDRTPADWVDVRVNGKTIARGEIVTIDDKFAIRLTEVG